MPTPVLHYLEIVWSFGRRLMSPTSLLGWAMEQETTRQEDAQSKWGDSTLLICRSRQRCDEGNSTTEPYLVAHNLLLSHGRAVALYRELYSSQKGQIGIVINSDWAEPLDDKSSEDQAAAQRWLEFSCGWFGDPVNLGESLLQLSSHPRRRLSRVYEKCSGRQTPQIHHWRIECVEGKLWLLWIESLHFSLRFQTYISHR